MNKPTPNPNWPRLSVDLPFARAFDRCGNCGRRRDELPKDRYFETWQECDHNDQPESIFIRLCSTCSKKIIEPHPRLYHSQQEHAPMPGAMPTCEDCKLRDGLRCMSALLVRNGGKGLPLELPEPARAMVDGPKYRGPMTLYMGPVTCKAKEPCAT